MPITPQDELDDIGSMIFSLESRSETLKEMISLLNDKLDTNERRIMKLLQDRKILLDTINTKEGTPC